MKFECVTDNTKKFTVGKTYFADAEHAKYNTTIIDDTGRKRIVQITHNGEGLRWNAGGNRHSTFGKIKPSVFKAVIGKLFTLALSIVVCALAIYVVAH